MGLFSQKKKEQKPENLPPLKFPELPSIAEAPTSTMKEAAAIKQAVTQEVGLKMRPLPEMELAEPIMEAKPQQPLFVKVDAYNEVIDTLSMIKAKLVDANHILEELTRLKDEEDKELTAWHTDLAAIKEKLMLVDQKLFE